jgi:SAM-dependent methyltransferase
MSVRGGQGERSHRSMMYSESGPDLTSDYWIYRHFRAMSEIYQWLLLQAELLPGDRVLDLGCGSGTHFAWIASTIGPEGQIVGVDPDADNIALARQRAATAPWREQVQLRQHELSALPYRDGEFDAVWCAGSLQYVPDPVAAIGEMVRVVRPGGKVAVQDVEMHSMILGPMPDELLIALKDCLPRGPVGEGADRHQYVDWFVGHKLRGFFHAAGLREVRGVMRQREYVLPFTDDERGFLEVAIPYLCTESPGIGALAPERRSQLADLANPQSPNWLLDRPDFLFLEGRALAVGVR